MTPERKEEIKAFITTLDPECELAIWLNGLLAALEETEQQLAEEKKWRAAEEKVTDECQRELAEAQQTIARQSAALGWYELGKPELARAALGEGAKEDE